MLKIAHALDIEITYLNDNDLKKNKNQKYYISKKNDRKKSDSPHPFLESTFETLSEKTSGKKSRKNMESFILYPDKEIKKMVSHIGEKLIYMIEGSAQFIYGDEKLLLEQGDHVYLDAEIPHGSKRVGNDKAKALVVLYFYKRH